MEQWTDVCFPQSHTMCCSPFYVIPMPPPRLQGVNNHDGLLVYDTYTFFPPSTPSRYLKVLDKFFNNYISCFVTGANVKFLLLHQPTGSGTGSGSSRSSTSIAANPTSAATEEAIKSFFLEVYENWVKAIMSPFYKVNMEVKSPIFRQRVVAAGKKYL